VTPFGQGGASDSRISLGRTSGTIVWFWRAVPTLSPLHSWISHSFGCLSALPKQQSLPLLTWPSMEPLVRVCYPRRSWKLARSN